METRLAEAAGTPPKVTDVVSLPESDPRGAVFAAGALPLVIGGLAAGVAIALRIAAATILLLGNPLSGITSAPELLPAGWSELGQLLPPGAAGTALRSTAFFDGAGAATPLVVLTVWLLVGLALLAWPARQAAGSSEPRPARRTAPRTTTAA